MTQNYKIKKKDFFLKVLIEILALFKKHLEIYSKEQKLLRKNLIDYKVFTTKHNITWWNENKITHRTYTENTTYYTL